MMIIRKNSPRKNSPLIVFFSLLFIALLFPFLSEAKQKSKQNLIDYRYQLHPNFKKVKRNQTKFIIIHTSEGGERSTLKVVSKGKVINGRRITYGGHANYVIARNGVIYKMLDKNYRADHAGRSLWNGRYDISSYSIGIELVGYHNHVITSNQYKALNWLLPILQSSYLISDKNILTHSQVAYGKPNKWIPGNHRGRKRCAQNFERLKAGLTKRWTYDPDVSSGRLTADKQLASIFYGTRKAPRPVFTVQSNIITKVNTAWRIAGDDYDDPSTYYEFPNGRIVRGDRIEKVVGWQNVPWGTRLLLNQTDDIEKQIEGPIKTIKGSMTAWTIAGDKYTKASTFYFFNGRLHSGCHIKDWDDIPDGTKIVVDYRGPFTITDVRTPYSLAGFKYNHKDVIYYIPDNSLRNGAQIKDFTDLPDGTAVLLPFTLKPRFAKK